MNLPASLFSAGWLIGGWLAFLVILLRDLLRAPWSLFAGENRLHVWLGAIVTLMVLWSMQAGFKPGLNLHFIGATVLVLAFGRPLAFIALCAVLAAVTLNRGGDWASFGLNALFIAALPTALSQAFVIIARRLLPQQMFVFIFANGFFGAGLTVFLAGAAGLGVLALAGAYPVEFLLHEYLPYFLMLGFAEAWLSGMAVTLFVVYRPEWLLAYDEQAGQRNR